MTEKGSNFLNFLGKFFEKNTTKNSHIVNKKLMATLKMDIANNLEKSVTQKMTNILEFAYEYDKTGLPDVECCVCYEENAQFVPLSCKHELCVDCKKEIEERGYTDCPYCRQQMKTITVYKKIALIANITDVHYGIIYCPPIHNNRTRLWSESEVFPYMMEIPKYTNQFRNSLSNIKEEKYAIMFCCPSVEKIFNKYFSDVSINIIP